MAKKQRDATTWDGSLDAICDYAGQECTFSMPRRSTRIKRSETWWLVNDWWDSALRNLSTP